MLSTRPSAKAIKRLKAKISETTDRDQTLLDEELIVTRLNQMLAGWANYFCRGPVSEAYRTIDFHVRQRIRRWLVAKHKGSGRGINQYPNEFLYEELGLIRLATWRTSYLRGRKACLPRPRAGHRRDSGGPRENCQSGSTSGKWKRSTVGLVRHRQTKEPETDRPHLHHRATFRLYL